jgi:glycosidase
MADSAGTPRPPPTWARGTVWYLVFPERFRNGNPLNDPRRPYLAPWNAAWAEIPAREIEAAWSRQALGIDQLPTDAANPDTIVHAVAFRRRFGGDLQGVVQRLDDLQDLGVTALYLCPIFRADSSHKYDASDFRHIDDTLAGSGPMPESVDLFSPPETLDPSSWGWTDADRYFLDVLLPEAHRRGLHVIIDGCWDHVGTSHWAFQDVLRNGRGSPYADWFDVRFGSNEAEPPVVSWKAWDKPNGRLPTFRRLPNGDLDPGVKAHIFNVTRRWMDPNGDGDPSDGIDGWRLDVAAEIAMPFWKDWSTLVRSINPDAVIIGEVWSKAEGQINAGVFDAQMNYPLRGPVLAWLSDDPAMPASRLAQSLDAVFTFPPATNQAQMNLLGSHDTGRLVTRLTHPDRLDVRDPSAARPPAEAYQLALLGIALLATHPGSPMIVHGDEWGVHGGNDPDCRKPLPWLDRGPYENPDDGPLVEFRNECKSWLRLRTDPVVGPMLRFGDVRYPDAGNPDIFVLVRSFRDRQLAVVFNRGSEPFDAGSLLRREGFASPEGAIVPPRTARGWQRDYTGPQLHEIP